MPSAPPHSSFQRTENSQMAPNSYINNNRPPQGFNVPICQICNKRDHSADQCFQAFPELRTDPKNGPGGGPSFPKPPTLQKSNN